MRNRFVSDKKRPRSSIASYLLPTVFFAVVLFLFVQGVSGLSGTNEAEQLLSIQRAVAKATVQCYALEGQYPPDLAYLESRYGLQVDTEKYTVHYRVIGSNIIPEIDVQLRYF